MRMKVLLVAIVLMSVVNCSNKVETVKLEKDTADYNLAKELTEKVAFLDPDKNNILIQTDLFNISTGRVILELSKNFGNSTSRLKTLEVEQLTRLIQNTANDAAMKSLLVHEAKKNGYAATEADVDSVMESEYYRGDKEAFLQRLANNGISIDVVRDDTKNRILVQRFLDAKLAKESQVTDEEILEAYQQDKTASVQHILLKTIGKSDSEKIEIRKRMEDILAKAKNGADFTQLATEYSEDPGSAQKGGLIENFTKGQMVKPFEEASFSVPVGQISDIVETRYGYHIIKIVDRKKESRPLEEVKQDIEKHLSQRKKTDAYDVFYKSLKESVHYTENPITS
jgi:foldase protein PrsA